MIPDEPGMDHLLNNKVNPEKAIKIIPAIELNTQENNEPISFGMVKFHEDKYINISILI